METNCNKQALLDKIDSLESQICELKSQINSTPVKSRQELMEETFLELMNQGLTVNVAENKISYYKDDILAVEISDGEFYFNDIIFKLYFNLEYGCGDYEYTIFLYDMLIKYFNPSCLETSK